MRVTEQPIFRKFWHAVMPLSELADGPKPFTLLGENIVVFLDATGELALLTAAVTAQPNCQKAGVWMPPAKLASKAIFSVVTTAGPTRRRGSSSTFRSLKRAGPSFDFDAEITREDKDILESTNPDAVIDSRRRGIEFSMDSDRPGILIRRKLMELLSDHGEAEIHG